MERVDDPFEDLQEDAVDSLVEGLMEMQAEYQSAEVELLLPEDEGQLEMRFHQPRLDEGMESCWA